MRAVSFKGWAWIGMVAVCAVFWAALWTLAHGQELPPRAFQHAPSGWVRVLYLPVRDVDFACRMHGATAARGLTIQACTTPDGVILPEPNDWLFRNDPHDGFAKLTAHENGHVNGWSHR